MENNTQTGALTKLLLSAAGIGVVCAVVRYRHRILDEIKLMMDYKNPLHHKKIEIIETVDGCQRVVQLLKAHCTDIKVLGFDCEWVTVGGTRRPVALLQLASHKGFCALFRLCYMKQIPKSLRDLLEDESVIKVGVGPHDDAQKLSYDYGVGVASTLDLRFIASTAGHRASGLAKLSWTHLNFHMDKNWRISCSDWEARVLSITQLNYAANDALVAVEIFRKLWDEIEPRKFWQLRPNFSQVKERFGMFFDIQYKDSFVDCWKAYKGNQSGIPANNMKDPQKPVGKMQKRAMSGIRNKAVYDNCMLQAPDGELLCNIDQRKAKWYLNQNLGAQISSDPFTVRLNFEPAGRAVSAPDRYYQSPKENQCVVCGRRDGFIRKNIIPREYRKFFPGMMKSHTSHDILLLCPTCHQLSNVSDLNVRRRLAHLCDAPLSGDPNMPKNVEEIEIRKVKTAARALCNYGEGIPASKREALEQIVKEYYGVDKELTPEVLEELSKLEIPLDNDVYRQHGEKVVRKFEFEFGGLIELEKLWRTHFLQTMEPKFLPALWNVNHNANRLEIRAQEGRVDNKVLIAAGLKPTPLKSCNYKLTTNFSVNGLKENLDSPKENLKCESKQLECEDNNLLSVLSGTIGTENVPRNYLGNYFGPLKCFFF